MGVFTSNISGPPPGTATTGLEQWIDLGAIPTGHDYWIGTALYTSPDKSIIFELRTNLSGQSLGTIGATKILDSYAVSPKSKTVTRDLYKRGALHTATVISTGTERWWLRLTSKSSTGGGYLYSISYTAE